MLQRSYADFLFFKYKHIIFDYIFKFLGEDHIQFIKKSFRKWKWFQKYTRYLQNVCKILYLIKINLLYYIIGLLLQFIARGWCKCQIKQIISFLFNNNKMYKMFVTSTQFWETIITANLLEEPHHYPPYLQFTRYRFLLLFFRQTNETFCENIYV